MAAAASASSISARRLPLQTRLVGRLLGGEGREPLVPQQDRQAALARERVGERPHRLAARPLAAVHVERPADHQRAGRALLNQAVEAREILRPAPPPDRDQRGRQAPAGIRAGDPERPLADVEREQTRPRAASGGRRQPREPGVEVAQDGQEV